MKKVFCTLFLLVLCACLCACSMIEVSYFTEEIPTSAAMTEQGEVLYDALENVLEAPILEADMEGIEIPAFLRTIESRNGYQILSFEKTETGAMATMRVFAPDVYDVAKKLDSQNTYTDEDVLMDALDGALKAAAIVEKKVIIEYVLTEEGYSPILTTEFLDAYYGGIYQLRDEIIANVATEG